MDTKKSEHKFEYEFGGPIGALATTLSLPIVTLVLIHFATIGKIDFSFVQQALDSININTSTCGKSSVLCPGCDNPNLLVKCTLILLSWFLFQVVLLFALPAEMVPGTVLKDGTNKNTRLLYRINGHLAFWVTMMTLQIGYPSFIEISSSETTKIINNKTLALGAFPLGFLNDHLDSLALCTIILCFLLSTYLYIKSHTKGALLAHGGNSGNIAYDFFMGRELNPRFSWSTFDWKEFCELRPGLIGWLVLNIAFLQKQKEVLGYVSGSMMLICMFQGIYVWDALYQERAILTTMDITTDGFGFMLVFGDLGWVPFTYSLQARYLVNHDPGLSLFQLMGILVVHAFGYWIFRSANSEKDAFRRNPDAPEVKHLKYLQTKRGTKLIVSGWWGAARKINYTGDWIMGLSWCMTCGYNSIVPYYYAIYFAILLVHRSIRDDAMCKEKYGDDWDEYKKHVPYRFIPGIL